MDKFEALKTLGYNYIARNMDGALNAWIMKPMRSMTVLKGNENRIKEKYKDADIYDIDEEEFEDYVYKDGCNVNFCWFSRPGTDDCSGYSVISLNPDDKDFDEVTWENSPYKIE